MFSPPQVLVVQEAKIILMVKLFPWTVLHCVTTHMHSMHTTYYVHKTTITCIKDLGTRLIIDPTYTMPRYKKLIKFA